MHIWVTWLLQAKQNLIFKSKKKKNNQTLKDVRSVFQNPLETFLDMQTLNFQFPILKASILTSKKHLYEQIEKHEAQIITMIYTF